MKRSSIEAVINVDPLPARVTIQTGDDVLYQYAHYPGSDLNIIQVNCRDFTGALRFADYVEAPDM